MYRSYFIVIAGLFTLVLWGCQSGGEHQADKDAEGGAINFPDTSSIKDLNGAQLAHAYCQQCHLLPDPRQLTKAIWKEKVLPAMGQRLGLQAARSPYLGMSYDEIMTVSLAEVFPFEKKITEEGWQKLVNYYVANAPDSMAPQPARQAIAAELPFFSVHPVHLEKGFLPLTTLVHVDTTNAHLWIGNGRNSLKVLDQKFQVINSVATHSPPVDMIKDDQAAYLLEIGIMNPSDRSEGKLVRLDIDDVSLQPALLDSLRRPVHLSIADLNQDGQQDYLISNFGYLTGKLAWYEGDSAENMKEHVLVHQPGAGKTVVQDFNEDGLPDIITLMAQGDERIIVFYNQGNGTFKAETVLRFPPEYGSSHFELIDFNRDGKPDILYANGDNADYSFALKNYHGIRIFENRGDHHFEEVFFYPLHGATMAKAEDFDQDGDLDIVATAFFADFERTPEEGFVYLENKAKDGYAYEAYTFPEAKNGRWLTFEVEDLDKDGDKDIILGSFGYSPAPTPKEMLAEWTHNGPEVMVLKNQLY